MCDLSSILRHGSHSRAVPPPLASIPDRSGNRHLLQISALDFFLVGSDVEVALLRNSALDEPLQASSLIHLAEVYQQFTFNSSLTLISDLISSISS